MYLKERNTYAVVDLLLLGGTLDVLDFVLLRCCEPLIIEAKRRLSIDQFVVHLCSTDITE
jgi:hypothetical protein